MLHVISVPFRYRRLANERERNVSPNNSLDSTAKKGQLSSKGEGRTESSRGTIIWKSNQLLLSAFMKRSENRSSEKEGMDSFQSHSDIEGRPMSVREMCPYWTVPPKKDNCPHGEKGGLNRHEGQIFGKVISCFSQPLWNVRRTDLLKRKDGCF
ncbi:hypothetical protein CDAR_183221 [Caerostris darwini]|uniref:Uncharacterized protein n=1 Tax=Caerostris darwini TaxID=1538125 RepID=A0AAV4TEN0_9ARAC|nr:hypothetical protein CDAR_183221 [Caerostris darwini]